LAVGTICIPKFGATFEILILKRGEKNPTCKSKNTWHANKATARKNPGGGTDKKTSVYVVVTPFVQINSGINP
jgi:hypothetical protein